MDNAETNTNEAVTPDAPVNADTGSNAVTDSSATPETGVVTPSNPSPDSVVVDSAVTPNPDEFQYTFPIEWRQHSSFTSGDGMINIIHEITLGDLLISTLLLVLIVWQVISRLVRR